MTNEHAMLARWINRHDEEAFHGILRQYSGLVYAACLRVLRNEADAQEAALDAFLALSQLQRVPDSPLGAWLHRTAVHRAIDRYRKTQTRNRYESALARESAPDRADAVGWDDVSGMVDEAVAVLPEELRQAVVGHFFEGKTHAELADAAGLSRQAITKRVHQGVEEVRDSLIKKGVPVAGVAALTLLLSEHAVAAPAIPAALAASLGKLALSGFTATGAAAGAAAGASMGLAAKALIAAVVLSIVAGIGYVALPDIAKRNLAMLRVVPMAYLQSRLNKAFPPPKTAAREVPALAAFAPATASAATAAAGNIPAVEEGKATVTGSLRGFFGGVVGESNVLMERVTWGPRDLPPAQTDRRQGMTDSDGNFVFEHVPVGDWSIIAWGPGGTGGSSTTVGPDTTTANRPIKVYPCEAAAGLVVDESGKPMPGAVLYPAGHELAPGDEFDHLSAAAGRAQADDQGQFRFPAMIQGGLKYFVVAPGREAQYSDYVSTSDGGMRVQLRAPGRVRGRVVAEGGVGGPGAVTLQLCAGYEMRTEMKDGVPVRVPGGRIEQTATTDPNGAFTMAEVPEATYRVQLAGKSAWLISDTVPVEVHSGKESSVTVRLEQGSTLSGRVLDAQTGEPLGAGIDVQCYLPSGFIGTKTGADGSYRIEALPRGQQSLQMNGPMVIGGKGFGQYYNGTTNNPVWSVEVKAGENQCNLRVSRARLHGLVTSAAGAPVAGVELRHRYGSALATSGANGRFDVRCACTPNEYFPLEAEKDGWCAVETVKLTPGGETEVTVRLAYRGGGELSGVALLSDGTPVSGMELSASTVLNADEAPDPSAPPNSFYKGTKIGADGAFALTGLVPGTYSLSAYRQQDRSALSAKETVTLRPDERRANVRLVFAAPESHTLAGTVFNEAGQAVPQCVVVFGSEGNASLTGPDGRFSLSVKTAERSLALTLQAKGYSPLSTAGEIDRTDLAFTLKKMRPLAGRVVNAAGAPVTPCKIVVSQNGGGGYPSLGPNTLSQTVSNPAGTFNFPEAFAPPATITVTADGYSACAQQCEGDEYDQPMVLVLYPAATIEGTVMDADGAPLAGYQVLNGGEGMATTDADGRFAFDKCGAGREYTVTVRKSWGDRGVWSGTVTAPASLQCRIGQTGRVALNVTLDGVPFADPALLAQQCNASAEVPDQNGGTVVAQFVSSARSTSLYGEALPVGPVQVRVRMNALEGFGAAVCEKVVEAQVLAEEETAVQVNFETPGAVVPAETPTVDNAPAAPGVTEE
jgi:RNA polymerase sigma factor (sigma-70 family)